MVRVPHIDPERARLISLYRRKLAYFESVPPHHREQEAADEGERDMRALLLELELGTAPMRGERAE